MKIKVLCDEVKKCLADAQIENARGEAKILLSEFGILETQIVAHPNREVSSEICARIFSLVERRKSREPLQYILGHANFFGREFSVGEGVLIPRPETELLIEAALEHDFEKFLDWGTGSGCIAATLLCERAQGQNRLFGVAAEKNPLSILKAWQNFKKLRVLSQIFLWHSQIPEDIPIKAHSLDLVISNPPYIKTSALPSLMPEVQHEPKLALNGGADGLHPYSALIKSSGRWLRPRGRLIVEIGFGQSEFFEKNEFEDFTLEHIKKDYSGIERVVCLQKNLHLPHRQKRYRL